MKITTYNSGQLSPSGRYIEIDMLMVSPVTSRCQLNERQQGILGNPRDDQSRGHLVGLRMGAVF